MVRAMAPNRFDILDQESLDVRPLAPRREIQSPRSTSRVLAEISIDHSGNQVGLPKRTRCPAPAQVDADSVGPRASQRGSNRRPTIESDTFEPLSAVQEESVWLDALDSNLRHFSADFGSSLQQSRQIASSNDENVHPLASAHADQPIAAQIEKQLAGQFEWLISYPAPARSFADKHCNSAYVPKNEGSGSDVIFGCNLLRRKSNTALSSTDSRSSPADTFTFIATPIEGEGDAQAIQQCIERRLLTQKNKMVLNQELPALCTPVKIAGVVEVVEQMLSPPSTAASDRTASLLDVHSPRDSAMSSPRIEDSLAEIDRLEDELEAMNLYTQAREESSSNRPQKSNNQSVRTPASAKRVTISSQPATMRIKSSEKIRPSLRRSSSLTFRERNAEPLEDIPEQKATGTLARSKSTMLRSSTLSKSATVKSTKPPTIPNFELPGEAVSRRLKEQREARLAQQAEAQKAAQISPPKPRVQKPLTRPNFELPGEAISRRKREQHEAKIKAQEEEERKRREFKARPIRYSIGPSTLPRDTVTSRARQNKEASSDHSQDLLQSNAMHTPGRTVHTLPRGRNSMILPPDTESRATSASTGSASGQRSTVSAEEAAQQRIRGRDIFARDNSFTQHRERTKREKETAAQLARAEAAARSRALSREWAEKKRLRELSLRQAMRESLQPDSIG